MKKKLTNYFILSLLLLTCKVGSAQLNYLQAGFSTFSSTYVDLGSTGTAITMTHNDSGHSVAALPIGFTFNFNSSAYDSFTMYVDGFIKLGSGLVSADTNMNFSAYNQPPLGGPFNSTYPEDTSLIFPMGNNLWPCNLSSTSLGTGTADFRVSTTGSPGTKVCTIQWKNLSDKYLFITTQGASPAPIYTQYDTINFQLKLFEGTNAIEFVYGRWVPSANTSQARFGACGIKGNNTSTGARCLTVTKGSAVAWGSATPNSQSTGTPLGNYTVNALNFGNNVVTSRPAPDIGRVYHFGPVVYNDAAVVEVRSMGKVAIPAFVGDPITAKITNPGLNAQTSLVVTLTVTGTNTYTTTNTISFLAAGTSTIVSFPAYTPANTGSNLLTISVPSDDNLTNNSYSYSMSVSNRNLGYTDTTRSFAGSNGSIVQIYACKYKVSGSRLVTNVRFFIPANSNAVGVPITGVVIDSTNTIVGTSATYNLGSSDMGAYVTLPILSPQPVITNTNFYVGINVITSTATPGSYLNIYQSEGDGTASYPPRPEVSYYFPTGAGVAPNQQYNGRSMIECTVDPIPPITSNTISGAQSICSNSIPNQLNGSVPSGGTGAFTYLWLSSTTNATTGFSAAAGTNNTQNYQPASLTATTWFKRVAMSVNSDTSTAVQITVNNTNAWLGTSTSWTLPANWGCSRVPISSDDVSISSGPSNMPVISNAFNTANNITIGTGATLTLNNAASFLSMDGNLTVNGTLSHTNGTIAFTGTSPQTISGASYARIEVANAAGVSLNGNATITDSLIFTNGNLYLNGNNLTLNGTASKITGATFTRYVSCNGTAGYLTIQNIGSGQRTGAVLFPVGNSSYNPITINNTGSSDHFSVRVIDSVTFTFTGSTPTGSRVFFNAVNRSWIINESTAGGSNATVTAQWNGTDEMAGFNRSQSYIARYTGTTWSSGNAGAPAGTNPYVQSRSGVTAFSPFTVGSGTGTGTLPVELLSFSGTKSTHAVILNWITASETNNDYFIVERAAGSKPFEAIGNKVKGMGNSNTLTAYNQTDDNAYSYAKLNNSSVLFYRLAQYDFNGTKTYSNVINVNIENNISSLNASVEPNPFTKDLTIKIHSATAATTSIKLMDMAGRILLSKSFETINGNNEYSINELDKLASGVYFVIISQGNESLSYKVVRAN